MQTNMISKLTFCVSISMVILLSASLLLVPVFAPGGGHLWFYSQDPDTLLGPQPLPNPDTYDPHYLAASPDPWLDESVVVPSSSWTTPFTIWLACAQFNSTDTMLVVSINDAASASIQSITVNGNSLTAWDTSGNPPANLAPHGVFNSAEFYGYGEVNVGNLYSPPGTPYKVALTISITLNAVPLSPDAKVHFDAYGYTEEGSFMFSPYSHDLNLVVPEPATVFAFAASLAGLALFAYKRRSSRIPNIKT